MNESDDKIKILQNTLDILKKGYYRKHGKKKKLKLSRERMEEAYVLLPDEVKKYSNVSDFKPVVVFGGKCKYGCEKMDSFSLTRKIYKDYADLFDKNDTILVLNLANPVNPGGGARYGAKAQEEDLCRKSSLLVSLESQAASSYYKYNKQLDTYMGSDAIIFSPYVEIIRDDNNELLDESVVCSVITCAAPMILKGKEGMSQAEYENMIYNRIMGMLKCSAYFGYKNLVLGAWGCGAFGNDAHIISDLFYKAINTLNYNGYNCNKLFRRIDFAVLSNDKEQYNYKEFYRNFNSEKEYQSKLKG